MATFHTFCEPCDSGPGTARAQAQTKKLGVLRILRKKGPTSFLKTLQFVFPRKRLSTFSDSCLLYCSPQIIVPRRGFVPWGGGYAAGWRQAQALIPAESWIGETAPVVGCSSPDSDWVMVLGVPSSHLYPPAAGPRHKFVVTLLVEKPWAIPLVAGVRLPTGWNETSGAQYFCNSWSLLIKDDSHRLYTITITNK